MAGQSPAEARGPLVEEALAAAREIDIDQQSQLWAAEKAACLAELLPLLDPTRREAVTSEALTALLAAEHDPGMPALLASHLTEPLVRQVLHDLEEARDSTWRTARLLPRLAELGYPGEALTRIATLPDASQAATALAACAQYLPEPQAREALHLARGLERGPGGTTDRAVALLLVQLAKLGHPEEAITQAQGELTTNHWMPAAASVLLDHVPQADRAGLALDALAAIQHSALSSERDTMSGLAIDAMDAPRAALLEWIQKILRELSHGSRSALLRDLTSLGPVIVALDGGDALAEVARAIRDACRWWPSDTGSSQPASWKTTTPEPDPPEPGSAHPHPVQARR